MKPQEIKPVEQPRSAKATETAAESEGVPVWAATALQRDLPREARVLNATTIERGRLKGSVLANTTRGAVLVSKSPLGEPRIHRLELPGVVVSFKCRRCGETTEAHDFPLPRAFHCANCGETNQVDLPPKPAPTARPATPAPAPASSKSQATSETPAAH